MASPAAERLATTGAWARRTADDALTALGRAVQAFFADNGPQYAAALSYYGLFSLFPLAILTVTAFGLIVDDQAARTQVIDFVLDNVPLREDAGRQDLETVLTSVTRSTSGFGVVGALGLVFAASAVMGTMRQALNRAWGTKDTRPPVQGKLLDIALVTGLGLLVVFSFALTLVTRLAVSASSAVEDAIGPLASFIPRIVLALGQFGPVLVAFAAFLVIFRFIPACRPRLRDVWPGAAIAALGFELAKTGFAFYLEQFSNYGAVYASLAAVVAFLVFLFVTANVFLLSAEIAVEWPRARGEDRDDDGPPLRTQIKDAVLGLFVRRDD